MSKEIKKRKLVKVCNGSSCKENKGKKTAKLLEEAIEACGLKEKICVEKSECMGKCKRGPVVFFPASDLLFEDVKPKDAAKILKKIVAAM